MARFRGFSPTLLVVALLAVAGGAAAALLGVAAPKSALGTAGVGTVIPLSIALDILLAVPVIALGAVIVWSLLSESETSTGAKGAIAAVFVVALLLVGLVWALHLSIFHPVSLGGGLIGGGGSGNGPPGSGGLGNGDGGSSNHSGGHGTGNGSKNSTTGNGTGNQSGKGNQSGGKGGGKGSGNVTSGGGVGSSGSGGNGSGVTSSSAHPPPPAAAWPTYVAFVGLALLVGAIVVPMLAARWANRRRPMPPPLSPSAPPPATRLFTEARKSLETPTDPRGVIQHLYAQLLDHLEPRFGSTSQRTPEEIRLSHLLPLGVRAEAAHHLTRIFEEACYSSHPMSARSVRIAQVSIQIAEHDLRATRAIG